MQENTNARLSQYIEENKKLVDDINKHANQNADGCLLNFVSQFYSYFTGHDVERDQHEELFNSAKAFYEFLQVKDIDETRIRVFNPNKKDHGYEAGHTVIEIVTKDLPFIVDSINRAIERLDVHLYRILHPVISVRRNKSGKLLEVKRPDKLEHNESLIQANISFIEKESDRQKIKKTLLTVIEKVNLAVNDWKSMIKKLDYCIADLPIIENQEIDEIKFFLKWLKTDNFIFLSYFDYTTKIGNKFKKSLLNPKEFLGVIKASDAILRDRIENDILTITQLNNENDVQIRLGKVNKISNVHRNANLDYIFVRITNKAKKTDKYYFFIGLYTTGTYYQSVRNLPIIRYKLQYVKEKSGFRDTSYNMKELVTIIESMPKDELFQISKEKLLEHSMEIFALIIKPDVKLLYRKSAAGKFLHVFIIVPNERYNASMRKKITALFAHEVGDKVTSNFKQIIDTSLTYIYININNANNNFDEQKFQVLEEKIKDITILWKEVFHQALHKKLSYITSDNIFRQYQNAFSPAYTEKFDHYEAINDIEYLEKFDTKNRIKFHIYCNNKTDNFLKLKIYANEVIPISQLMPILNNMGFNAIDESTHKVSRLDGAEFYVHYFRVNSINCSDAQAVRLNDNIAEAFEKIWHGKMSNDGFNKLLICTEISWRQVQIVRAICKYIRQTGITYSQYFMEEVLAKNPKLSKKND